jgi:hypothetical protein
MSANEAAALQYSICLTPSNIDPNTDTITYAGHGFAVGDVVQVFCSNGQLPTPLTGSPNTYDVINATTDTFQLAASGVGTLIDIQEQGTRAFSVLKVEELSPSAFNRIVTNFDPRLNTIRNPYATFGPTGSVPPAPSFFGTGITDLIGKDAPYKEGAIPALTKPSGTVRVVKAVEILPGPTTSPNPPQPYLLSYTDSIPAQITLAPDTSHTIPASAIDITSDTITLSGHPFVAGDIVYLTSTGTLPSHDGALIADGECFGIANTTSATFQLTRMGNDYGQAVPIDITDAGTGTHTIVPLNALMLDVFTPQSATFRLQTFSPAVVIEPGTGAITIRGLVIEIQGSGTSGAHLLRDGVTLEECTIVPAPGEPMSNLLVGLTIDGNDATIRRCRFLGNLTTGVSVGGDHCRFEDCTFQLTDPASVAVEVYGNECQIDHSIFYMGKVFVGASANNCQISSNQWPILGDTSIEDNGVNTRILSNLPQERNQPFVGRTRSVGTTGSFADFRGNDETPFIAALSDPHCDDVLVFGGSYTISNPITIPSGKSVRAAQPSKPVLTVGTSGFVLADNSIIDGLAFTGQSNFIQSVAATNSTIKNCTFNSISGMAVDLQGEHFVIDRCIFTGAQGVRYSGELTGCVTNCVFQTAQSPIDGTGTSVVSGHGRVEGNVFISPVAPTICGKSIVVRGNQFIGATPQKISTISSVWRGNHPTATTNNALYGPTPAGVDQLKIQLENVLAPLAASGAARDRTVDVGGIAFVKGGEGTAMTLPIKLDGVLVQAPFTVTLAWTSAVFSGGVVWEATCVFRDRNSGTYGTPVTVTSTTSRTKLSPRIEEQTTLTFPAGFGAIVTPTHVCVKLRRLSRDTNDTLHGTVHLVGADITFNRT